jgi:hypothetical protein
VTVRGRDDNSSLAQAGVGIFPYRGKYRHIASVLGGDTASSLHIGVHKRGQRALSGLPLEFNDMKSMDLAHAADPYDANF